MIHALRSLLAGFGSLSRSSGRWREDVAGASLVQFIVVLPVFVLIVVGLWAMYQVYSAQQTLCEAVWHSSRYLQVEGPLLDTERYPYPDGWERLAVGIINTEITSNTAIEIKQLVEGDVIITPRDARQAPQNTIDVSADTVSNSWFFVQAKTVITNPLAIFVPGTGPGGALNLTCKGTAFYEGPPIGPTNEQGGVRPCPPPNVECTRPPPGPTVTPTACPPGEQCCPVCRPDR